MKCTNCGKEIADDSVFCEFCGTKIQKQQPSAKKGNAALWVTLGIIGGLIIAGIIVAIANSTNEVIPISGTLNGHEWVDLGLPSGTKWATCNVGANSPEEYGDYFAWGETKPKNTYTKKNYMYFSDPATLPSSADAATTNWGAVWRMPTKVEWEELVSICKWTWMSDGYKVVGPNGNGLFLPASGVRDDDMLYGDRSDGEYWSSSLDYDVWVLAFASACNYVPSPIPCYNMAYGSRSRYGGLSVRPVCVSTQN